MHRSTDDEIPYDPRYDPEALDPEDEDYEYHKIFAKDLLEARRLRLKMEGLESRSARRNGVRDARLTFSFTRNELDDFTSIRLNGLAEKSHDWIKRASQDLCESKKVEIAALINFLVPI